MNSFQIAKSFLAVTLALVWGTGAAQVDTDATTKTKQLYTNLKEIQNSSYFLFGQEFFNSFRYNSGAPHGDEQFSDSKDVTGAHPAVLGSDFHYYLEKDATEKGFHLDAVKWAYQQGYAITFDWHLSGKGTTTYEYTEQTKDLVDSIVAYPNGQHRAWLYGELDKVIDIINNSLVVNAERIPIVFRPWHEMNGSWFWWGTQATTSANYKALYALTADYVKARTTSVLFCWSPNYPVNFDYYPGDDYVDVVGVDYYEVNASNLRSELGKLVDYAQGHSKVAVFSESGNRTNNADDAVRYWNETVLPAIVDDPSGKSLKIAWLLTWINASWSYAYVPHSGSSAVAKQSFRDFKGSHHVLFGDVTQNMYSPWLVLGVQEKQATEELELFPIPAGESLTIRLNGFHLPALVQWYDVTGRMSHQVLMTSQETTLDMIGLFRPGLYLIKAADDVRSISKKIIIR